MKVTYDPRVDAAYIYLRAIGRGDAVRQVPCDPEMTDVILDFDRDGRLIGIEVLSAKDLLPPEILRTQRFRSLWRRFANRNAKPS